MIYDDDDITADDDDVYIYLQRVIYIFTFQGHPGATRSNSSCLQNGRDYTGDIFALIHEYHMQTLK